MFPIPAGEKSRGKALDHQSWLKTVLNATAPSPRTAAAMHNHFSGRRTEPRGIVDDKAFIGLIRFCWITVGGVTMHFP
jgi:hypothetical protein